MLESLNSQNCISTLIIQAHGYGCGGCHIGDQKITAKTFTHDQISGLRKKLCKNGTIIMASCHNNSAPGDEKRELQSLSQLLGVKVCTCPGGTYHVEAMTCRVKPMNGTVKPMNGTVKPMVCSK